MTATHPRFGENLSEAVRKYPALNDKSDPGFNDRHKKNDAWTSAAKERNIGGYYYIGIVLTNCKLPRHSEVYDCM